MKEVKTRHVSRCSSASNLGIISPMLAPSVATPVPTTPTFTVGPTSPPMENILSDKITNASNMSGQGRYGGIHRSRASSRPPCDGSSPASLWLTPRKTPGPSCPYHSDRTPYDANMKSVDAPPAWSSPSDLDYKESDGRDPPQGVAPHPHRGVVGAHDIHTGV